MRKEDSGEMLTQDLYELSTEVLALHATMLLRLYNRCDTKDEQRAEMRQMSREDLVEFIQSFFKPAEEDFEDMLAEQETRDFHHYTPSATNGDYSPACPWNAPGMSVRDFI